MPRPIKVIFIAGWGRSGSTILDMLLGQIDNFFSAGEIRYVWDRGLLEDRLCGCSVPFRECGLWSEAAGDFLRMPEREIKGIVRSRDALHSRQCWQALTRSGVDRLARRHGGYARNLAKLIRGLADATGTRVLVDSSKFPSHGVILDMIEEIELYVVHLVRDPRAVAFSWHRKKIYDTSGGVPRYIELHNTIRSSLMWLSWNSLIGSLWGPRAKTKRYLFLRYEDLIQSPSQALTAIAELLEIPISLPFLAQDSARIEPSHMVAGNPARFQTGRIALRLDEEWKSSLSPGRKAMVTLCCLPLMWRYGYLDESL